MLVFLRIKTNDDSIKSVLLKFKKKDKGTMIAFPDTTLTAYVEMPDNEEENPVAERNCMISSGVGMTGIGIAFLVVGLLRESVVSSCIGVLATGCGVFVLTKTIAPQTHEKILACTRKYFN